MYAPYGHQGAGSESYRGSPDILGGEYNPSSGVPRISISTDVSPQHSIHETGENLALSGYHSPDTLQPVLAASSEAGYSSASSCLSVRKQGNRVSKRPNKGRLKERNFQGIPLEEESEWKRIMGLAEGERTDEDKAKLTRWSNACRSLKGRESRKNRAAENFSAQEENANLRTQLVEHQKSLDDLRGELAESKQREKNTRLVLDESEKRGKSQRKFISTLPNRFPSDEDIKTDVANLLLGRKMPAESD